MDELDLTRMEIKLENHIDQEEVLLRSILERLDQMNHQLTEIKTQLGVHGERSQNQHERIKKAESLILYGGGLFVTIFSGLIVAILTGAI